MVHNWFTKSFAKVYFIVSILLLSDCMAAENFEGMGSPHPTEEGFPLFDAGPRTPRLNFPEVSQEDILVLPARTGPIQLVEILCCASQEMMIENWLQACLYLEEAHNALESLLVGNILLVNIGGHVDPTVFGFAYSDRDDPELAAGNIALALAQCYEKRGDLPPVAEWYGVAGWHYETDPKDLKAALGAYFLCASAHLAVPYFKEGAFYPLLRARAVIQHALNLSHYADSKAEFIQHYIRHADMAKLCSDMADTTDDLAFKCTLDLYAALYRRMI